MGELLWSVVVDDADDVVVVATVVVDATSATSTIVDVVDIDADVVATFCASAFDASQDIIFTAINHTYFFRGPQACLDTLGIDKYRTQLNKEKDKQSPPKKGRCGLIVNLPIGCFSNLTSFLAFGNNALNTAHRGFPNKG